MISVYFATNRNPIGDPPEEFGDKLGPIDGAAIRVGTAEVDLVLRKQGGDTKKSEATFEVFPEKLIADSDEAEEDDREFGSDALLDLLYSKMLKHSRDSVIYLHGFANTFHDALVRGAEIKNFLNANLNVFVFTWPSDGKTLFYEPYFRDRSDVESSGEAFARAVMILARFLHNLRRRDFCEQRIHVIAHSMGNYALQYGIKALERKFAGEHFKVFDKVFLMGSDVDSDALTHPEKLAFLPSISREIFVYHTPRDRALTISDKTKGLPDRLGSDGPPNARELPDKISVIDVTDVLDEDPDLTNHQYYRLNPLVRKDVVSVLQDLPWRDIPGRRYDEHSRRFRLTKV